MQPSSEPISHSCAFAYGIYIICVSVTRTSWYPPLSGVAVLRARLQYMLMGWYRPFSYIARYAGSQSMLMLTVLRCAPSQCMLMLLEEQAVRADSGPTGAAVATSLRFSSGAARLGGGVAELLADRPATHVRFCDTDGRLLVSAHAARTTAKTGDKTGDDDSKKQQVGSHAVTAPL